MRLSSLITDNLRAAKADPAWGIAYTGAALLPWMLIFSRLGAEICCALAGLAFLWHSLRTRDWSWTQDPFVRLCAIAYLWLLLIVTPLAISPHASFTDAGFWFRLPLFFVAMRYWVLVRREALVGLAVWVGVLLALVIVDTLWQFGHGTSLSGMVTLVSGRLTGPFTSPKVGLFIAKLLLPTVAILFVYGPKRHHLGAIAAAVLLLVGLATIILSGERSAFLSTVLGGGIAMLVLMAGDKRVRMPCLLIMLAGSVLMMGLYLTTDTVQIRAQQMVQTMAHYPQSDYGMLVFAGIDIGLAHPLHGTGLKGFRELCPELNSQQGLFRGMHPHNAFVEWFSEAGVLGLGLFLAMLALLGRMVWQSWRAASPSERLIPALALGVLVQHYFPLMGMQSFFTNWPALHAWFALSLIFAALPNKPRAA